MASEQRDELLLAYQRELLYLRRQGAEFAARYPKIAARLDLAGDHCADPHVERLIESFAFLNARVQRQLDGEFPHFTSSLLNILYPHFLEPVPSMSIARFEADPDQGLPLSGYDLPVHSRLFAQTATGSLCRFRTAYPVTLWPIAVTEAQIENTERYAFLDQIPAALSVLRVRLQAQKAAFSQLTLDRLRFFLNGEGQTAYALYDLLFSATISVALLIDGKPEPVFLSPEAITPVGLERDEAVLPSPPHGQPGYRLLQEYFVFPEKFLFFDLKLPEIRQADKVVDVLILLSEAPRRRLSVSADTFALGCAPIVNLFPKTTEPVRFDQRQLEYPLVADKREERTTEIHSILSVSSSADPSFTDTIAPFFSFTHPADDDTHQAFYQARREPMVRRDVPGTEMYISFCDLRFQPKLPPVQTVYAHTLCTNRDLAEQMPAGALLQIEEAAPLREITCLRKPTPQIDLPLGGRGLWLLISQLSINHLSLTGGAESLHALHEILRLYRFSPDSSNENQVMGITQMNCRPVLRHVGQDAWRGFCQGLEVTLTFEESLYVGNSALLLSAVLGRFFGLYAAVNSFTQLVVKSNQRQGVWKRWQPMAGDQSIL